MASEAGKGDKRRPGDDEKFSSGYELAFGDKKPTRGSFIWDSAQGKMVPKEEYYYSQPQGNAPAVLEDIKPYKSMITGELITSRSKHREHLRQHGMIEVGNEVKYMHQNHERSRRESAEQSNKQLKQMVIDQVNRKFR